ncbi:MAG: hypothetical protein PUB32_05835 [Clostridiales bacterium]|nr:hypothetical protein [Clostridiales bacterium]
MVKRKLCVRLLSALFAALALIIMLCSCAPKNEMDVLSGEEIALLRDTYPLDDRSMTSGDPITFEKAAAKSNAVAVVTVTDEWFTKNFSASTTGDADEPFPNAVECAYLPVKISDLLYGDGTLAEGDEISLFFGSTLFFDSFDTYPVNGRFLCFISKGEGTAYYDDTVYSTAKQCSAYVTDNDYILSVMSKGPFEDYTGYALASYSVQLDNMLTELNEIAAE